MKEFSPEGMVKGQSEGKPGRPSHPNLVHYSDRMMGDDLATSRTQLFVNHFLIRLPEVQ